MPANIRFADFEFDPASGELTREGRRVRLQRQPSRLLQLLLERPGDVRTRDEIRQALWGDDTHVDFDRSLNFCVARLRSALRDNAADPRFIETVPTRGYRFLAAVSSGEMPAPDRSPHVRVRPWWSRVWAAAAAVCAIAAAVGISWYTHPFSGAPKIVVVPFHNETGSPELDRLAKGVSDATVVRLATPERLPQLRVIGNATDLPFSFKPRDMKAIGDSLDAQYLLLGQMKKDDRRMRIVAHLIRVSDQTHLWAKTYDTDTLDLPQQASIAEQIATSVAAALAKG